MEMSLQHTSSQETSHFSKARQETSWLEGTSNLLALKEFKKAQRKQAQKVNYKLQAVFPTVGIAAQARQVAKHPYNALAFLLIVPASCGL